MKLEKILLNIDSLYVQDILNYLYKQNKEISIVGLHLGNYVINLNSKNFILRGKMLFETNSKNIKIPVQNKYYKKNLEFLNKLKELK